jgi:electron transfer flavoprotein alpha subunit
MIFGGSKIANAISTNEDIAIVLMRPKSNVAVTQDASQCMIIETDAGELIEESQITKVISEDKIEAEGVLLEDANIVVSGGRGLGSAENFEALVGTLATLLNGATGASRAIVDAGWVPYSKQVGQTGKTVKPEVYFACGISGATQHQVGMKGSKKIIAINTDADAPIFSLSDVSIVGDVNTVMPKLIEAIKQKKS